MAAAGEVGGRHWAENCAAMEVLGCHSEGLSVVYRARAAEDRLTEGLGCRMCPPQADLHTLTASEVP